MSTEKKIELTPEQRKRIAANRLEAEQRRRKSQIAQEAETAKKKEEGCRECGCPDLEKEMESFFSVRVCSLHRRSREYDLVTASDATKEYLLPKASLKVLPSMTKSNPRGFFYPMKLYLRLHLENAAVSRWGSEDKLEEEKIKRRRLAWDRTHKKASRCFDDERTEGSPPQAKRRRPSSP